MRKSSLSGFFLLTFFLVFAVTDAWAYSVNDVIKRWQTGQVTRYQLMAAIETDPKPAILSSKDVNLLSRSGVPTMIIQAMIARSDRAKDLDGDGIFNEADRCPSVPETVNGCKDNDGCADIIEDCVPESVRGQIEEEIRALDAVCASQQASTGTRPGRVRYAVCLTKMLQNRPAKITHKYSRTDANTRAYLKQKVDEFNRKALNEMNRHIFSMEAVERADVLGLLYPPFSEADNQRYKSLLKRFVLQSDSTVDRAQFVEPLVRWMLGHSPGDPKPPDTRVLADAISEGAGGFEPILLAVARITFLLKVDEALKVTANAQTEERVNALEKALVGLDTELNNIVSKNKDLVARDKWNEVHAQLKREHLGSKKELIDEIKLVVDNLEINARFKIYESLETHALQVVTRYVRPDDPFQMRQKFWSTIYDNHFDPYDRERNFELRLKTMSQRERAVFLAKLRETFGRDLLSLKECALELEALSKNLGRDIPNLTTLDLCMVDSSDYMGDEGQGYVMWPESFRYGVNENGFPVAVKPLRGSRPDPAPVFEQCVVVLAELKDDLGRKPPQELETPIASMSLTLDECKAVKRITQRSLMGKAVSKRCREAKQITQKKKKYKRLMEKAWQAFYRSKYKIARRNLDNAYKVWETRSANNYEDGEEGCDSWCGCGYTAKIGVWTQSQRYDELSGMLREAEQRVQKQRELEKLKRQVPQLVRTCESAAKANHRAKADIERAAMQGRTSALKRARDRLNKSFQRGCEARAKVVRVYAAYKSNGDEIAANAIARMSGPCFTGWDACDR